MMVFTERAVVFPAGAFHYGIARANVPTLPV